jgi:hypothetical protein
MMTTGEERRRFLYKSDGVKRLIRFFDGAEKARDVAGSSWIKVGDLAEEVGRQLSCGVVRGELVGDEVLIDPILATEVEARAEVPLSEGLACVIREARGYLGQRGGLT